MTILHSIILGIVEGITEFLPISSTGHLILTAKLLKLNHDSFLSSFEIGIQFGAILSVLAIYWRKIFNSAKLWKIITVAFIPTAIIGFLLYAIIKHYLMGNASVVLWSLAIGGLFIIIFEYFYTEKDNTPTDIDQITYKQAAFIGICQSIAVIPGVSRSAATILGGLSAGLKRKVIVEFSFLLAIPTMLAATGYDLLKTGSNFNESQWLLLFIGALVSFVVAYMAIKFLLNFIQKHTFAIFGYYRILVAIIFWLFILK